jgi:hypothetical protein
MAITRMSLIFREYRNFASPRAERTVDLRQDLVVIRKNNDERCRASVHLCHDHQFRHDERLEPFAMDRSPRRSSGTSPIAGSGEL